MPIDRSKERYKAARAAAEELIRILYNGADGSFRVNPTGSVYLDEEGAFVDVVMRVDEHAIQQAKAKAEAEQEKIKAVTQQLRDAIYADPPSFPSVQSVDDVEVLPADDEILF
jgi:hypothetical protein